MAVSEAEEPAATEAAASAGKAGGSRRLSMLLVLGPLAALALLGGVVWWLGWLAPAPAPAAPVKPPPVFYALPEFTTNLSGGERPSYLRIKIVLEAPDRNVLQALEPQLPRIIDLFQVYLRELRPADLSGSAGLYRLREELVRRINLTIAPKSVNDVLFQEILIQ